MSLIPCRRICPNYELKCQNVIRRWFSFPPFIIVGHNVGFCHCRCSCIGHCQCRQGHQNADDTCVLLGSRGWDGGQRDGLWSGSMAWEAVKPPWPRKSLSLGASLPPPAVASWPPAGPEAEIESKGPPMRTPATSVVAAGVVACERTSCALSVLVVIEAEATIA